MSEQWTWQPVEDGQWEQDGCDLDVDALQSTRHEFEYIYRPYQTGQYNYQPDVIPATEIQVSEDSSLATMIASESVLAKDWDTPEEDEAWAEGQEVSE